jgi:hypothetical protein
MKAGDNMDQGDPAMLLHRAFQDDNANLVRNLLARHPEMKAKINQPVAEAFDSPPITLVKSREMLDVLLEAGADINAKSRWWAGGFGLLHSAAPELARYAVERGAVVDTCTQPRGWETSNGFSKSSHPSRKAYMRAEAMDRRPCTSRPTWRSPRFSWITAPKSTRATWITSPRLRNT